MANPKSTAVVRPVPWPASAGRLPPLSTDRQAALRESLDTYGWQGAPIYVLPDGRIIDGHHRFAIMGDRCPFDVIDVDEATALALTDAHNLARRHLAPEQIRELYASLQSTYLQLRKDGKTQAEAARTTGVPQRTASHWDKRLTSTSQTANTSKSGPATKIPEAIHPDIAKRLKAGETQQQLAADYGCSQQRIAQIAKRQTGKESKAKARKDLQRESKRAIPDGVVIANTDFRKQAKSIPDKSVALIFTDPPYDRASIPLYGDLAEIAGRVLMPGGSLLCYCGQYVVPDVYALMTPHLRAWWIIAAVHGGGRTYMKEYGIVVHWKPILWLVRDTRGDRDNHVPDLTTGKREKDSHDWQQAESEAAHWITTLTQKGDLVWDPFCGSGTTAAAAVRAGRRVITCDVKEEHVQRAKGRLAKIGGK